MKMKELNEFILIILKGIFHQEISRFFLVPLRRRRATW